MGHLSGNSPGHLKKSMVLNMFLFFNKGGMGDSSRFMGGSSRFKKIKKPTKAIHEFVPNLSLKIILGIIK